MLEGYSTNATVAKIRAVYGSMLTMDDLRELVAKRSVSEVCDALKRSPRFSEALRDIDPNTIHRGHLENILHKFSFDSYVRFCGFQKLDGDPFFSFYIKSIECQQMINLVNAISNGLSRDFVEALPGYLLEHSKLRLLQLAKCEGFDQLVPKLKGTPYYKPLLGTARTEDGRPDFTDAEIRIRTAYYSGLMQSVREASFSKAEKEELEALIKSDVDMINIINSLRLKTYFGYNADDIKLFMLPFTGTGKRVMQDIYSSDTPEQMLAKIEHTKYGRAISEGRDAHDIERSLQQNRLRQMKHTIAGSNSAAVVMYAFMYICDNEIRNLVRIIEGVRYDVEPALIFKLLVV